MPDDTPGTVRLPGLPSFDALCLAVQFRAGQGHLPTLAMMTGIPVATLARFCATGEIDERSRMILEVYQ